VKAREEVQTKSGNALTSLLYREYMDRGRNQINGTFTRENKRKQKSTNLRRHDLSTAQPETKSRRERKSQKYDKNNSVVLGN
jgi:hypothetical protein